MPRDEIYISYLTPLTMASKDKITTEWFRFFGKIVDRVKILTGTSTNSAVAGTAAALPALPAGYMTVILDGVEYKVPYYK